MLLSSMFSSSPPATTMLRRQRIGFFSSGTAIISDDPTSVMDSNNNNNNIKTKNGDRKDNNNNSSSSSSSSSSSCSPPLGYPLPSDEHACSVSLPTWSSVVGYEEGDPNVTTKMKCGYPRFVYHPYVLELMQAVLHEFSSSSTSMKEDCLVLPSKEAALRCQAFLQLALSETRYHREMDNALITNETINNTTNSRIRMIEWNTSKNADTNDTTTENTDDTMVYAVLFPATTSAGMQAKAYWQHTGEVFSSRRAERALHQLNIPLQQHRRVTESVQSYNSAFLEDTTTSTTTTTTTTTVSPHDALSEKIAKWAGLSETASDHVFLTPSGMSSIYMALRSARRYQLQQQSSTAVPTTTTTTNSKNNMGGTSIVYGFPYLDTLKMCSRPELSPDGVEFFGMGDDVDLQHLEQLLETTTTSKNRTARRGGSSKRYSALFTEVPSNPLLQCPDLVQLRKLADQYNFCLVVDDTISNFLNVDVLKTGIADAVCTSLTKLVSGRGDAMAGSVVCNPYTEKGRWMQQDMAQQEYINNKKNKNIHKNGLHAADARAILNNSQDFVERNEQINQTAVQLAEWLHSSQKEDVATVYYPKLNNNEASVKNYHHVMRGGYGGLISIVLNPHMCQRYFYDALDVAKGPSLGTNFTLVCPYTLLAHYHELDFAMGYNVPPNLIRIAVGLEPLEQLQEKFQAAFEQSRLYPAPVKHRSTNTAAAIPTTQQPQTRSFSTSSRVATTAAAAAASWDTNGIVAPPLFARQVHAKRVAAIQLLRRVSTFVR